MKGKLTEDQLDVYNFTLYRKFLCVAFSKIDKERMISMLGKLVLKTYTEPCSQLKRRHYIEGDKKCVQIYHTLEYEASSTNFKEPIISSRIQMDSLLKQIYT